MALQTGTRVGPYEVMELVGSGAMGEVYRARDTRLKRAVALKVLPSTFAQDPIRLRRFEQEARAAGALNHPNILAIHDLAHESDPPYVVSELLEGDTLRQRLAAGPLAPRKVIELGMQVARGLAAAHDRGIVHRDLKPENIFLTRDGVIKILDFGLAKQQPALSEEFDERNPTLSLTEPGAVLGTVGYMSPEQVRGQEVDGRSDIFSLGAILYEMATGRKAFKGRSAIETLHAILKEDPEQITDVDPTLPPALERVVTHCLEKDPGQRFQSARDLAFDLEALSHVSHASGRTLVARRALRWQRVRRVVTAVALLALPVAGFLGGLALRRSDPAEYRRLTFRRGTISSARFSPDGQILYAAAWDGRPPEVFAAHPDSHDSRALGLSDAGVVGVSNGEAAVLLRRGKEKAVLARLPLAGGPPREILDDVWAADWSRDGSAFAVVRIARGRQLIEYPIGSVLYDTLSGLTAPRISPAGDAVAFLEHPIQGDDRGWVSVVDRAGKARRLSSEWSSIEGLAWAPNGRELFFTAARVGADSTLHAVTLDGDERLLSRVPGRLVLHDVDAGGRFLIERTASRLEMRGRGPDDAQEHDLSWFDYSAASDLSPDGRQVLFGESGEGGGAQYAVFLRGTNGSLPMRIGEGRAMALSPDSKWVLSAPLTGPARLLLLPTGAGQSRTLQNPAIEEYRWARWLPDGKTLLFAALEKGHGVRLYTQPFEGGAARAVAPEGVQGVRDAVTPDGRSIVTWKAGEKAWFLQPLGGGEPSRLERLPLDVDPLRFSADGKALYVQEGRLPAKVSRIDLASGQREPVRDFAPADPAGVTGVGPIRLSADGRAYAYHYHRMLSELYLVNGLR